MATPSNSKKLAIPSEEEFEQIRVHLTEPDKFSRQDLGVVHQRVANNDLTTHGILLPETLLKEFAQQLVGAPTKTESHISEGNFRPVYFNLYHTSLETTFPLGKSFHGETRKVEGKFNVLGQPLVEVIGKLYTLSEGSTLVSLNSPLPGTSSSMVSREDIAQMYNAGLFPSSSLGGSFPGKECSVCGTHAEHINAMELNCSHNIGQTYEGKLCVFIAHSGAVLNEFSLVPFGSVQDAGAISSSESFSSTGSNLEIAFQSKSLTCIDFKGGQEMTAPATLTLSDNKTPAAPATPKAPDTLVAPTPTVATPMTLGTAPKKTSPVVEPTTINLEQQSTSDVQANLSSLAVNLQKQLAEIQDKLTLANSELAQYEKYTGSITLCLGKDPKEFLANLRERAEFASVKSKGQSTDPVDFSSMPAVDLVASVEKDTISYASKLQRGTEFAQGSNSKIDQNLGGTPS